jgi:hypothetical protein
MTDEFKDPAARLVVGRKRDDRSVYDEHAKLELVMGLPQARRLGRARCAGVRRQCQPSEPLAARA